MSYDEEKRRTGIPRRFSPRARNEAAAAQKTEKEKPIPRRRDKKLKGKKLVSLTPEGQAVIQKIADDNNVSFSQTIESLALVGAEHDIVKSVLPMLEEIIYRTLQTGINRIAKLTALSVYESGISRGLLTILLQRAWTEDYLDHVRSKPQEQGEEYINKWWLGEGHHLPKRVNKAVGAMRFKVVKRMKNGVDELSEILEAVTVEKE